jgi:hypothetical protein
MIKADVGLKLYSRFSSEKNHHAFHTRRMAGLRRADLEASVAESPSQAIPPKAAARQARKSLSA